MGQHRVGQDEEEGTSVRWRTRRSMTKPKGSSNKEEPMARKGEA